MRSDAAITNMMELMYADNWPEGTVARGLLNQYLTGERLSSPSMLSSDLAVEVLNVKIFIQDNDETRSKFALIRVTVIVWMLGNDDLVKEVQSIPVKGNDNYLEDRLELVCTHYGLDVSVGQSEEE